MRIENLRRRTLGDRTRVEARFVYEDCGAPPIEIYYEAGPPLADALEATPEAFVLPGLAPALWEGERRLRVEGALDTTLAVGLERAAQLLGSWYDNCGSITIESTEGLRVARPRAEPRSVALFSGGVDAFAMLRENRRLLPLDHPRSIRSALYAFGFSRLDRRGGEEDPYMRARYEANAKRLEALGETVGFDLIRLDTNVRLLYTSRSPFWYAGHGAAILAPLVASPGYLTEAWIASAAEGGPVQTPHGSHPMLDAYYSTGAVRVVHAQPQVSRLEKTAIVADWEPAYDALQVCHGSATRSADMVNCGQCEKCVRTMLALLICGALPRFKAFRLDDVTPGMIDAVEMKARYDYLNTDDIRDGLRRIGRRDLLRAIDAKVKHLPDRAPPPKRLPLLRRLGRKLRRLRPLRP